MEMVEVTVMVDDVDELGALSGSATASVMEGATDLDTYTLSTMDDAATWTVDGADSSQFMLDGTGISRMLTFNDAPRLRSTGRRRRRQHLHGHRHGLGRRRRGDDGSHASRSPTWRRPER